MSLSADWAKARLIHAAIEWAEARQDEDLALQCLRTASKTGPAKELLHRAAVLYNFALSSRSSGRGTSSSEAGSGPSPGGRRKAGRRKTAGVAR